MRRRGWLGVFVLVGATAYAARGLQDEDLAWRDFIAWFQTSPVGGNPLGGYQAALRAAGKSQAEVQQRMSLVAKLLGERSDWIEVYFDKTFARPVTGNPAQDGFNAAPSVFLAEVIRGHRPGSALDAGMGQGRNAVYLASQGWKVTGFDISGAAVAAATDSARRAGVRLDAIKARYADFDFGLARWDLIVLAFAWAPVKEPGFVGKLRASLRPGGLVVFEHFVDDAAHPRPAAIQALVPGQLRLLFDGFRIERYEELEGVGDWGGPGERLVRMAARAATGSAGR